jgi:hypothetical protein
MFSNKFPRQQFKNVLKSSPKVFKSFAKVFKNIGSVFKKDFQKGFKTFPRNNSTKF